MALNEINNKIDLLFEEIKTNFLKSSDPLSLGGIFESAAKDANGVADQETLQSLIQIASNYIEAEKGKFKARLFNKIKALSSKTIELSDNDLLLLIEEEIEPIFTNAAFNIERIIVAEGQTAKNFGALDGIVQKNNKKGIDDPVVFFKVLHDNKLCVECKRLHLLDDGLTPRLWLLSELSHDYHKKGDDVPSIQGEHPHCFTGEMKLHTSEGLKSFNQLFKENLPVKVVVDKRIKNYKKGGNQFYKSEIILNKVRLDRHDKGSVIKDATNVYDTGIQKCVKITLKNGYSLEVSDSHEMWVDDGVSGGKKIKANEIKIGDNIPVLSGEGGFGKDNFPELAELMGNLMGDGSITNSTACWHFFGNDIEYGNKLKKIASLHSYVNSNPSTVFPPNNKYNVEQSSFNSSMLKNVFIKEFNLSKKPRRIPQRLWQADKNTVSSFLRGLYAADGHVETQKTAVSIVLAQNDKVFLQEIQVLLSNFGLVSYIFDHGKSVVKKIKYADGREFYTNRKPCYRLVLSGFEQCEVFYKEISLGVPIKNKRLEIGLNKIKNCKKLTGSYRTSRVEKIENIGLQQTFCLTEPFTNTVTVNGIVTGNCRCELTTLLPGFGFENGNLIYKQESWDEYEHQRNL